MQVQFAVPEGQDVGAWFRTIVEQYGTTSGPTIPAQTEAAWVAETAMLVDLLCKPHRLGWSGGAVVIERDATPDVIGRVIPGRLFEPGFKVTNPATRFDWSPTRPARGMSAAAAEIDHQKATMALAQLSILREVVTTVSARETARAERAGGWIGPAVAVGSVVLLGFAFKAYLDHLQDVETLQSAERERIARARIAQAGQDFAARLAQLNATGTMPAPSAAETAVAQEVQQRAQTEWSTFWQGAAQTAGKVGTYALGGLALLALVKAMD